jgi:hypothetical protein
MSSKFLKTFIIGKHGEIIQARINMHTGEIKPYKPRMRQGIECIKPIPKAAQKAANQAEMPFWMDTAIQETEQGKLANPGNQFKPRKNRDNSANVYLSEFDSMHDACEGLPNLDSLLVGTSNLEIGSSMPVSSSLLFHMLQNLQEINTLTIMQFTGYSESYARKLAALLRVALNAFEAETED